MGIHFYKRKMVGHDMLDLDEWGRVRDKMLRLHTDVTDSVKGFVQEMMTAFRPELMSEAEKQSKFGQEVCVRLKACGRWRRSAGSLSRSSRASLGAAGTSLTLTTSTSTSSRTSCSVPSP